MNLTAAGPEPGTLPGLTHARVGGQERMTGGEAQQDTWLQPTSA